MYSGANGFDCEDPSSEFYVAPVAGEEEEDGEGYYYGGSYGASYYGYYAPGGYYGGGFYGGGYYGGGYYGGGCTFCQMRYFILHGIEVFY